MPLKAKILKLLKARKHRVESRELAQAEVSRKPSDARHFVPGDNPIRRPEEDVLGRSAAASSFAKQVLELDASQGAVVGVLGPWGSGKTSFVNLARIDLGRAGATFLDFNPWMFSGTQQLVDSFFVELSAQLRIRPGLAGVGEDLASYGEAFSGMVWIPVLGPWVARTSAVARAVGKILKRREQGMGERRTKLQTALATLDSPIVVFLDDLDRLSTSEIRDIFRLVRLTASFPNVVYILAFDRTRVEAALTEDGVPGRLYLEKILQVVTDLPALPTEVLHRQTLAGVESALSEIENRGPFNEQAWPDVYVEVVRPLIRNMRDVRRYASAIRGTVAALTGEVALVDVLALEAVRVFLPDVFARIQRTVEPLTATSNPVIGLPEDSSQLKAEINALVESDPAHAEVTEALIKRLFPAAERHVGGSHYASDWRGSWLKERRVAHADVLRLYLERVAGEGFRNFRDAERACSLLSEAQSLDRHLRSLEADRLEGVIASLEIYESEFAPHQVVPATVVLLNLLPDLPQRKRGMFELAPFMVVGRVVLRVFRALKNPDEVEAAVRQTLPQLTTLSSKMHLIELVGHRKDAGHKLVTEKVAAELEKSWRSEVREASVEQLSVEWDLLRVLFFTKREADSAEPSLKLPDSPKLTLATLRSAGGEVLGQSLGSRSVKRTPQLAWDVLTEIYGSEASLREHIESLKQANPNGEEELLELAMKYLDGWRLNHFGEFYRPAVGEEPRATVPPIGQLDSSDATSDSDWEGDDGNEHET